MYETSCLTSGYAVDKPAAYGGRIYRLVALGLGCDGEDDESEGGSSSEPVCTRSFACGIASSLACTLAGGAVVFARSGGEGLALASRSGVRTAGRPVAAPKPR